MPRAFFFATSGYTTRISCFYTILPREFLVLTCLFHLSNLDRRLFGTATFSNRCVFTTTPREILVLTCLVTSVFL
ncbi:unnamed protein product [Laminaria digitata]